MQAIFISFISKYIMYVSVILKFLYAFLVFVISYNYSYWRSDSKIQISCSYCLAVVLIIIPDLVYVSAM